jgi:hypothetical protein
MDGANNPSCHANAALIEAHDSVCSPRVRQVQMLIEVSARLA